MAKKQGAPILRCQDVSLEFGGVSALVDISFEVREGEVLSIIGPNGAGKTCIVNVITGFYRPWRGEVYFKERAITKLAPYKIARLGIARTFQNIELFVGLTVLDNLLAARYIYLKPDPFTSAVYFGLAHRKEVRERERVEKIIDFLEMEAIRKTVVGSLPYGQRKRVELGRALALEPELILLDEPTAGMNVEEKEDIVRFILDATDEMGTTTVLIEHDMSIVMDISDRVIVLDFGRKIAEGPPEEVKTIPEVLTAYLGQE